MKPATVFSSILRRGAISPQAGLVGIAVVGLFVRFLRIDAESVWLDESFSIWAAQRSFDEMMAIAKWDPHPPLHYLLLKIWMGLFGTSEMAVRSLSAVAGAGAVWAIGHLFFTLRLTEAGLYAAALLAFSPMHVWYSQETRSVTLFFLAAVLATATLLRVMQDPTWRNAAFYFVCATTAFYTHAYSVFLFAAHGVIYLGALAVARQEVRISFVKFVLLHVAVGIACLPWAIFSLTQAKTAIATLWMKKPTMQTLVDSYVLMAGSMLLLIAILALGAFALLELRRNHAGNQRLALITAILLGSAFTLGGAIVSWNWRPIFLPRAAVPALAGLVLLAAAGLSQLPQRIRTASLVILLTGSAVLLHPQLVELTKDDWRGAVGRVNQDAQPGDIVILDAGFTRHVFDYYSNRTDLRVLEGPTFRGDIGPWLQRQNATLEDGGRVWHFRVYSDDHQQLISKELAKHRTKTFSSEYWGIRMHAWDVNQTAPAPPA